MTGDASKMDEALGSFRFSPSDRREYLEWVTEAKQDETRQRGLAQAIERMSAGKSRNWKYEKC